MKKDLVLVINAGSTSLKYSLLKMPEEELLLAGNMQGIASSLCSCVVKCGDQKIDYNYPGCDFTAAISHMMNHVQTHLGIQDINERLIGVGHRVVHGADAFSQSEIITDNVLDQIDKISYLAPLHNIPQLKAIRVCQKLFNVCAHAVIFDTSFHQTISQTQHVYPIPYNFYHDYKIRLYGAHGTSYRYILHQMRKYLKKDKLNLLIAHIGGGVSCCAIKDSLSFATTMGYGPLGGCVMATRSGDLDPTVIKGMMDSAKISFEEVWEIINKNAGLKGISQNPTGDMRIIESKKMAHDNQSTLAYDIFINAIIKYLSYYYVLLDTNIDALILTAGIGENSALVANTLGQKLQKAMAIKLLSPMPTKFNELGVKVLSSSDSTLPFYSVATNEELMMAIDTYQLCQKQK